MLSSSGEIAGPGAVFLYVGDVAAERRRLKDLGIALGGDLEGDYSTLAEERRRNRALEKELRCKERALAETAALLVLSRKLDALRNRDEDA